MLQKRIIPSLLLRNGGLVKGIKFNKHKYVGDPINAVKIFNSKEVDELILFDIDAGRNNVGVNFELLEDIASEAFFPLGYGGGIKTLSEVEKIIKSGFEKIVINTAALENPNFVKNVSSTIGSQSTVVAIDVKRTIFGFHQIFTESGSKKTKISFLDILKEVEGNGAGEIILTSIDREGTAKGFDQELIALASQAIDIPLVINGGAGRLSDLKEAIDTGASAVCAGSMFTFQGKHRSVLISYPNRAEIESVIGKS